MAMNNERDRISEIAGRRGDTVQIGATQVGAAGYTSAISPEAGLDPNVFGVDFRSPWLRDRVTLSLQAQIMMVEQRSNSRLGLTDLGYTNRINVLELRQGIFVKVEPTGCYRLAYNNR